MQHLILNNDLLLPCPEGFRLMEDAERDSLQMIEKGPGIVLSDPARHMMISVGWKQPNGLALLLLSDGDLVKKTEQTVRKAMQPCGYRAEGPTRHLNRVAGLTMNGFRYGYTAQGVEMSAETCILRRKKTLYFFHCYVRAAQRDEGFALWESVLGSIDGR